LKPITAVAQYGTNIESNSQKHREIRLRKGVKDYLLGPNQEQEGRGGGVHRADKYNSAALIFWSKPESAQMLKTPEISNHN